MQIEKSEREQFGVEHTQSSTFGPTDAPLLARWAKLPTVVQIFISMGIVILLIARAVGGIVILLIARAVGGIVILLIARAVGVL